MQVTRIALMFLGLVLAVVLTGCVASTEYDDLKVKNRTQQERLGQLESELATANLQLGQLNHRLATAQSRTDARAGALKDEIAALEDAVDKKNALITSLQAHMLRGGVALPVELNAMLQDFAETTEMVTYDSGSGVVKFKSDLLFERGSDNAAPAAVKAIKALCGILNSKQGKDFDVIIAGHTDNIPIKKPATRAKHPTNWHLSAHRGISVEQTMQANGVSPKRLSVRAFGEYRPVAKNKPKQGGNPKNRRVEIYIVPAGM